MGELDQCLIMATATITITTATANTSIAAASAAAAAANSTNDTCNGKASGTNIPSTTASLHHTCHHIRCHCTTISLTRPRPCPRFRATNPYFQYRMNHRTWKCRWCISLDASAVPTVTTPTRGLS